MSERFHLALTAASRPAMHGWWSSESTARGKFTRWVGTWGLPGVRITLVDEETGVLLDEWPAVVGGDS